LEEPRKEGMGPDDREKGRNLLSKKYSLGGSKGGKISGQKSIMKRKNGGPPSN